MIAYLDNQFDEVSEELASLRIERTAEVLFISRLTPAGWRRGNPFCFGEVFPSQRDFASENILKLKKFVLKEPGGPYAAEFPYENQISCIMAYGIEEIGIQIPEENALLLAKLYHSSFPIFWEWSVLHNSCVIYDGFYGSYLSGIYQPFYSESSYEALVTTIFGIARKDSLRETRNFNIDQLSVAYLFLELLPIDVILSVLKSSEKSFFDFELERDNYQALNRLSPTIVRRLMEDIVRKESSDPIMMSDALTMLYDVPEARLKRLKGVRSWNELHERTMKLVDVDSENNASIIIPKRIAELVQASLKLELKLVPLMRAEEFINVGSTLDICLGKSTYFSKARHGESYCVAGFHEDKVVVVIELSKPSEKWQVLQYRGFKNSQPANVKTASIAIENFMNLKLTVA